MEFVSTLSHETGKPMAFDGTFISPKPIEHDTNRPYGLPPAMNWGNWYKHVNWINVSQLVVTPAYGIIMATRTPLRWQTALLAIFYFWWTGIAVTAGYHRLWSHRSYNASAPLRYFLAFGGAAAIEGSARHWATQHRAHHRYIDTNKDPYSADKGLVYAHMGWLVFKEPKENIGKVDVSDIKEDPIAAWQHKHFWPIALFTGALLPSLVASTWGDAFGAFIYAGILRIFFVNHSIFCVNSLAHWLGDQPFDDRKTARNHFITAFATFGEGWHNYHHEFPTDYRNGIEWHDWDPTKWSIELWKAMGLASNLKTIKPNEIEKSRVQQLRKKLDQKTESLEWGAPIEQLPVFSWDEYQHKVKEEGRKLISVAGVIHDVEAFIEEHPGGKAMINAGVGKDATAMFNGGVYLHSNAAHNFLATMRIGVLRGGGEVEVWKKEYQETVQKADELVESVR